MATVYIVTEHLRDYERTTICKVFSTPEKTDDYLMSLPEADRIFYEVEIWDVT